MKTISVPAKADAPEFLSGGGELGQRMREFDWSKTSLGPVSSWPKALRTCVQIMLMSRQPYWIGWGKDLIKLYNDPYKAIVGGKHPWALGKPASVVWNEIWKDIEPLLKKVMEQNEGIYMESQLLIMERNGYPEETYYTFSYTPVAGDNGGIEGMICANSDDTNRIISERQLKTLTELGKSFTDAATVEDVYKSTVKSLSKNSKDFTFALIYELHGSQAILVESTTLGDARDRIPSSIDLKSADEISQLMQKVATERKSAILNDVRKKLGDMPMGAWDVSPDKVIILPVVRGQKEVFGFLVVGVNPFRLFDQNYQSFFELVADQVATSLSDVYALEQERKRLEALAEIDRAKTAFFSNISHEFRTPLTLLLGPIQDALNEPDETGKNRERMDVALRNAHRMQKLVNLLLDFSRIEAGRMEASFTAVDVVALTEDLVSNFRSAVEKAGMQLIVRKNVSSFIAHVDIDMWEKIILNLVSNAFKYSEKGTIEVTINKTESTIQVAVKDDGLGIPESELGKIFERFHRVQNVKGRSQEGTGIGLAMVKELVKLHQGSISVKSKVGNGSVFTVSIPVKEGLSTSLDHENFSKNGSQASVYIEEVLQWLPQHGSRVKNPKSENTRKLHKVILADDNADMRKYIQRLLDADYEVIPVADGEEAFAKAIEEVPDLILSDIMMPKLDGFGLLQKLKSTLPTRNIPVIFLSARAGEEARVEGISAGADDYLTKPFSSKELLARVSNHIAISNTRRKTEREFYNLFLQSPAHIHVMKGPEHVVEFFHPLGIPFAGRDITGMKMREAMPQVEGQGFFELLDKVYNEGEPIHLREAKAVLADQQGELRDHYFNITYLPWKDLSGNVQGVLQFTFEVTELVKERLKAEASERNLKAIAEQAPVGITVFKGPGHVIEIVNEKVLAMWGRKYEDVINRPLASALPEIVSQGLIEMLDGVYKTGKPYFGYEMPVDVMRSGKLDKIYFTFIYQPLLNAVQEIEGIIVVASDVTEQVLSRQKIEEAEYKLKNAVELADLGTWNINLKNNFVDYSPRVAEWWGLPIEGAPLEKVIACIHPDDQETVSRAILRTAIQSGSYEAEYRLVHAVTKQQRYVQANGKIFYDENKKPERLSGIVRDVSLFKLAQQELERQVSLRTAELVELNRDLSRSNENLRQFAYVASHDLQEPLRKIQTFSGMAKDRLSDPQSVDTYLMKIDGAAARMSALIKDVLLYSQISKEEGKRDTVDLNEVLENVKSDFELLIDQRKAVITSTPLPTVTGSKLHFHQLFSNLIGNSLKFCEAAPRIEVTSSIEKNEMSKSDGATSIGYRLVFRDNGIGFDPEFSEQIFGLFTRLHNRKDFAGTGIGLALCKKIVESYGGTISAESHKGKGAAFIIYLPADGRP